MGFVMSPLLNSKSLAIPRTEVTVMIPISMATQHSPVHIYWEGRSHSKGLTYEEA